MNTQDLHESNTKQKSLMRSGGRKPFSAADAAASISQAINDGSYMGAYLITELDIRALTADPEYNPAREPGKTLAAGYDPKKAGIIIVSLRLGKTYMVDGWRRCQAAMSAGYHHMLCAIASGLSQKEEAAMCLEMNLNTKGLSPKARFKLMAAAGDQTTLDIKEICQDYGMSCLYLQKDKQKFVPVACAGTLLSVEKDPAAGMDCVRDILYLLSKSSWKGLPGGTSPTIVQALALTWKYTKANTGCELADFMKTWDGFAHLLQNEPVSDVLFSARKQVITSNQKLTLIQAAHALLRDFMLVSRE